MPHRDQFDRIIAAIATVFRLPLVTKNANICDSSVDSAIGQPIATEIVTANAAEELNRLSERRELPESPKAEVSGSQPGFAALPQTAA